MKGPVEFSVLGASTGHGTGQFYVSGKSQCSKLPFSNPILRHLFRLGLSVKGRIPGICFQTIWGSTPETRRRIDFQVLFREAIQRRLRGTSVKPMARIMRLVSAADGGRLLTFGILQDIMRRHLKTYWEVPIARTAITLPAASGPEDSQTTSATFALHETIRSLSLKIKT